MCYEIIVKVNHFITLLRGLLLISGCNTPSPKGVDKQLEYLSKAMFFMRLQVTSLETFIKYRNMPYLDPMLEF